MPGRETCPQCSTSRKDPVGAMLLSQFWAIASPNPIPCGNPTLNHRFITVSWYQGVQLRLLRLHSGQTYVGLGQEPLVPSICHDSLLWTWPCSLAKDGGQR